MTLVPLLAILMSSASQAPPVPGGERPYTYARYTLDALDFRQADLIDRLCIVEAQGRSRESRATGDADLRHPQVRVADVSVEEGKVLDGLGKGRPVKLVAFDPPDDPPPGTTQGGWSGGIVTRRPAFAVGKRYLALAVSPQEGRLYQPFSLDEPRFLKEGRYIAPGGRDELSLLAAFPTEATALPTDADPARRLLDALVDALTATRGWDRERLVYFLSRTGEGNGFDPRPDAPAADRLRTLAKATRDSLVRLSADAVLVNWRVLGSEGPFLAALMDAADAPPLDFRLPDVPMFAIGHLSVPPDYRVAYDRSRANRLAALAPNDVVRHYLFEHAAENPSPEDKALYARNLALEPAEFVDRVMLKRLAQWDGEPAPVLTTPPGRVYPEAADRAALIAHWRAKYPMR